MIQLHYDNKVKFSGFIIVACPKISHKTIIADITVDPNFSGLHAKARRLGHRFPGD